MLRRGLRLKLLLSHLGLIVMAMGLAGVLLLTFLQRYFLEATEESLVAQARITAQALIPGAMAAGPPVEVQAPLANTLQQRQSQNLALQTDNLSLPTGEVDLSDLDLSYLADSSLQLGTQLETRIRVLDAHGQVLVDSAGESAGQDLSVDPLVAQALTGQYESQTTRDRPEALMAVAVPVLVESELVGVVYLTQPLRDVNAVLGDVRARWLWSTAIALILSGAVGLLLSRAITRPLRGLTTAAGAVAAGDFDQEVPVRSRDELGRLSRAFNDMTRRLRAARQTQTAFVANVSHELRTPLTAIKGTVETLRAGAVDDASVRDRFLATVEHETDRLIRLVNDLLVLTRADAEALNLRREPLDLAELARVTSERLAPRAEDRDVTLKLVASSNTPLAWADRDRAAQILVNLLDNAIKYSREGGEVVVRIAPDADSEMALVQVQDEGIGISAEDLPQIGQRFYRADKARTRARRQSGTQRDAQSGSGLGLSIAVALVEAHGGALWIESQEGAGTAVSFTLPAA
ncbi:MAG: ATP-binding protein [Anaerolineae bacterium]